MVPPKGITNVDYLLGNLRTFIPKYETGWNFQFDSRYAHHFTVFNSTTIRAMLRDPRIRFALWLIKGPIYTYTKFFSSEEAESPDIHASIVQLNYSFPYAVRAKDPEVEDFILSQIKRFWELGSIKALTALEWGYSASQVIYRIDTNNRLAFDNLYLYSQRPEELQCLIQKDGIVGFRRRDHSSNYIPIGKGFWHVQGRDRNPYYGESRLLGAHIPWNETWMLGGARDTRRTWFFRNAYDGGEMYYPEGNSVTSDGQIVPNEHIAVQMMEAKRTGSHAIYPSSRDLQGKLQWEYVPPRANPTPTGLLEYVNTLRDEELEGVGIPPEVIRSESGNGLGSATGRMVPYMAFVASLSPVISELIHDFRYQILNPVLLPLNRMPIDYEIEPIVPKTISETTSEESLPEKSEPSSGRKQLTPIQEKTVENTGLTV